MQNTDQFYNQRDSGILQSPIEGEQQIMHIHNGQDNIQHAENDIIQSQEYTNSTENKNQEGKQRKPMKAISKQVNLDNLVFEKRERKKSDNKDQNSMQNGKKNKEKPQLQELYKQNKKIKSESSSINNQQDKPTNSTSNNQEEDNDFSQENDSKNKINELSRSNQNVSNDNNSQNNDNSDEEGQSSDDDDEDDDDSPQKKVMTRKGRGQRSTLDFVFPRNIRGEEEDFGKKKKGRKKKRGRQKIVQKVTSKQRSQPTSERKPRKQPKEIIDKKDQDLTSLSELNRIFKKDNKQGKNIIQKSDLFKNHFKTLIFENPKTDGLQLEEDEQNNGDTLLQQEGDQNNTNQIDIEPNQNNIISQNNENCLQQLNQNLDNSNIQQQNSHNQEQQQNNDNEDDNQEPQQQQIYNQEEIQQLRERKKEIEQDLQNCEGKSLIHIQQLKQELQKVNEKFFPSQTYLNCDLKYFNLDFLTENFGNFDVILADPPWRIKGGQGNDSQFMFSNSRFNLEYNTMSNQEIRDLKIEKLSKKGFMFLWILNTQMNIAYEMMNKWGYEVIDQIVWVKLKDSKIYLSHGYYFMHSFEICLVGFKNPQGEHVEYLSKISNNIIFAEVRKKSQKPEELYEMIDLMMPGSKKIELFSRNHNLRPGWFSLGNQLGELYEKWDQKIHCDECYKELKAGIKRYKSKSKADHDLCEECIQEKNIDTDDFLQIENKVDEDILHYYHKCDHCHTEPIWGIRFECQEEQCFHDYCESCLDKNISLDPSLRFHDVNHKLKVVEVPKFAHGFQVHSKKCQACHMKPIIGTCFTCKSCSNFNLCQPCFFSKTPQELSKGNRGHKADHKVEAIIEPQIDYQKQKFKCNGCSLENISGDVYQCDNCYGFYFCQKCYLTKRDDFKTMMATSHKNYHQFTQIQFSNGVVAQQNNHLQ